MQDFHSNYLETIQKEPHKDFPCSGEHWDTIIAHTNLSISYFKDCDNNSIFEIFGNMAVFSNLENLCEQTDV